MRTFLVMAAASLLMPVFAAGQQSNSTPQAQAQTTKEIPSGFECVDQLQTPDFPKAALQKHVDGSVWTWTKVSPQGTAEKIDTQVVSAYGEGPNLLTPPAEKALKESKFKTSCAGKTVSVVFRYELHGQETANPKVTSRRENPDILYIESQPEATASASNHGPKH